MPNTSQHSQHETYPVPLQQCYNFNPITKIDTKSNESDINKKYKENDK